jgi:hypothetical protein
MRDDGRQGNGAAMMLENANLTEVLFEFHRIGNTLRVSAIDPLSNTEVTIVASAQCGDYAMKRIALRKLAHVLGQRVRQPAKSDCRKKA